LNDPIYYEFNKATIQGYVLDTSAIINMEHSKALNNMEFPDKWLVVPSGVARELNVDNHLTPEITRRWLKQGKAASFTKEEELLYRKLVINPAVDDGEAQAIAMAFYRKKTLVIDEKKNGQVWKIAESYGIRCIDSKQFLNEIKPQLPL
jgi:predicted nucleic acid-binding protein